MWWQVEARQIESAWITTKHTEKSIETQLNPVFVVVFILTDFMNSIVQTQSSFGPTEFLSRFLNDAWIKWFFGSTAVIKDDEKAWKIYSSFMW